MIVHHHAVFVATVRLEPQAIDCDKLRAFLTNLVDNIDMQRIFDPIAIKGKFGYTGVVGIVTSHIAFHYYDADRSLHLDVYSCKPFDLKRVAVFVDSFWQIERADVIFVNRAKGPTVERFVYENGNLRTEPLR